MTNRLTFISLLEVTAVGKTKIALEWAEENNAEIFAVIRIHIPWDGHRLG